MRLNINLAVLTIAIFSVFYPFSSEGNATELLESRLTQGGFYIGQVEPGSVVHHNGKPVRMSSDGRFVIGFGRDAEIKQTYSITDSSGQKKQVALVLKERQYDIQKITGVASKYVRPAKGVLERIKLENGEIRAARAFDTRMSDFFSGFSWPAKGPITGVYGSQRYFNGEPRRPHFGLDIAGPTGTPVISPADGVVRLAEPDFYFSGGTIIIDHGFGLSTSYLHLSSVAVDEGEPVKRGEVIGRIGATGRVTGAHLDWRLNWFDQRLDPALMLQDEEQ